VSRVYVVVRGPRQQVLAYCASSAGTFLRDHLPPDDQAGLPRNPLPTAHLGRLAVDLSCRGQRLGELLLFHFLRTACDAASGSACSRWTCSPRITTRNAYTKSTDSFRCCGSRKPRRPAGSTQKGPLSASPIERVTIRFTAWKKRRTFGADNSPTLRSHDYEQVCHNGIFGMDSPSTHV
jgi:hypothetical protein